MDEIQITIQKCHYGYENNIMVYWPISLQQFAFIVSFIYVRVNAKPSDLLMCSHGFFNSIFMVPCIVTLY